MKRLIFLVSLFGAFFGQAQQQPKLIVGIVVDQMRADYIYRYWNHYGEDGFKKLINDGKYFKNTHYNYIPTYTGPGHASIYTGTTPMVHGIIANSWYDRASNDRVYCAQDPSVEGVGGKGEAGQMSPAQLLAPGLGDAVRIVSQFKGKSIGISIKDRGAILPAGHAANAAYWLDYETGDFISSTHYMKELPSWLKKFNGKKLANELAKEPWDLSLAASMYQESTADLTKYEKSIINDRDPVFPYDVRKAIDQDKYYGFACTPYGNTILRLLADQLLINEDLGQDQYTDLLAISFSSPDMIGHRYGPQSMEIEDTYIKLDREIALLLKTLNDRVGEGNYLLFLTADHAAAEVPAYLKDHKIPVGLIDDDVFEEGLVKALATSFPETTLLLSYSNQQVFLDLTEMEEQKLDAKKVYEVVRTYAMNYEGVANVLDIKQLQHPLPPDQFSSLAAHGWNPQRSGDLMIQYLPGWMEYGDKGTTHGSSYAYDTHVPLLFYGWGVEKGQVLDEVRITQIAPTVAIHCNIPIPHASEHGALDLR